MGLVDSVARHARAARPRPEPPAAEIDGISIRLGDDGLYHLRCYQPPTGPHRLALTKREALQLLACLQRALGPVRR